MRQLILKIFKEKDRVHKSIQDSRFLVLFIVFSVTAIGTMTEMKLNRLTLALHEKFLLQKYNKQQTVAVIQWVRLLVIALAFFVLILIVDNSIKKQTTMVFLYLLVFLSFAGFIFASYVDYLKTHFKKVAFIGLSSLWGVSLTILIISKPSPGLNISVVIFIELFTSNLNLGIIYSFATCVSLLLLYCLKIGLGFGFYGEEAAIAADAAALSPFDKQAYIYSGISVMLLLTQIVAADILKKYRQEKNSKNDFLNQEVISQNKVEVYDILSILIPQFVQEYIAKFNEQMSEQYDDISILFADILNLELMI